MIHYAHSSNGCLKFDDTGKVVECLEFIDCKGELSHIATIDMGKLREVYPEGVPDDLDILECGYTTHDGQYEPPLVWDEESESFKEAK